MEKFDKLAYFKELVENGKKAQAIKSRIETEIECECEMIDIRCELEKFVK